MLGPGSRGLARQEATRARSAGPRFLRYLRTSAGRGEIVAGARRWLARHSVVGRPPIFLIRPALPGALIFVAAAVSVGIAVYLARMVSRAFGVWIGKWRALWAYRTRSRRARRIVAAVELIDGVLAEPYPKVTDAAEIRAALQRLLAVIAAERDRRGQSVQGVPANRR